MALNIRFDISGDPPTEEKLHQARADIQRTITRATKTAYIITIVWLVGSVTMAAFLASAYQFPPKDIKQDYIPCAIVILLFVMVPSSLGWFGLSMEQTNELKKDLAMLAPASGRHCAELINWCGAHEEIRAYQNKTAALHRPLTEAEYRAALIWVQATMNDIAYRTTLQPLTRMPKDPPKPAPKSSPPDNPNDAPPYDAQTHPRGLT
jgi:hypothetical protein